MSPLEVADNKVADPHDGTVAYVPPLERTAGQPEPIAAHGGLSYMAFDRDGDAETAKALEDALAESASARRYIRRLVNLAFLSPQPIEAIMQGRQPAELTVTRLTELDLPIDWAEQHRLLAS
jgi:hypothetical protein